MQGKSQDYKKQGENQMLKQTLSKSIILSVIESHAGEDIYKIPKHSNEHIRDGVGKRICRSSCFEAF